MPDKMHKDAKYKKSQGTEHLFDEKRGRKGDMGTRAMERIALDARPG